MPEQKNNKEIIEIQSCINTVTCVTKTT